jgi:large subunit ribosomal protein L23
MYLIERYNQYIFDIDYRLTKPEIFLIIEKIFSIRIAAINTYLPPRRKRTRGRITGFLPIRKRVFITLKKGEKITFFPKSLIIFTHFLLSLWICELLVLQVLVVDMRFWIRSRKSLGRILRRNFCIRIIAHEVEIVKELLRVTTMVVATNGCIERSTLVEKN